MPRNVTALHRFLFFISFQILHSLYAKSVPVRSIQYCTIAFQFHIADFFFHKTEPILKEYCAIE